MKLCTFLVSFVKKTSLFMHWKNTKCCAELLLKNAIAVIAVLRGTDEMIMCVMLRAKLI